jgi:hypothetical protein
MPSVTYAEDKESVLESYEPSTSILVHDVFGNPKWKRKEDILDSDKVVLGKGGEPKTMTGLPGRPSKNKTSEKTVSNFTEAGELAHLRKKKAMEMDPLLLRIRENSEGTAVFDATLIGMAEESASLAYERVELEKQGLATSQVSLRRIGALKAVGDAWLKRKEIETTGTVDLESPAFQKLFGFIMHTFRESLEESGLRSELIETVFSKVSSRIDGDWEREAARRMVEDK